jgi:hypothetical protein
MKYGNHVVTLAAGIALLGAPLVAEAQRGGGGRGGGGGGRGGGYGLADEVPPPTWADSVESALGQQKPVIVYIQPPTEGEDIPGAFKNPDVSKASREAALLVRIPYKAGDPFIKERKIAGAPTLLGLDSFGNEWHRSTTVSTGVVKEFIRLIPEEVSQYVEMLEKLLQQAKAKEEKEDIKGALPSYKKLALEKRKGYPQIATGRDKFKSLGDKVLADAVTLLGTKERDGLQELNNLSNTYSGTPLGAAARLAILKHDLAEAKDLRVRVTELQKLAALEGIEYSDVVSAAKSLLEEIDGYGQARVQDAVKKAERGDAETAKNLLRQIMSDFTGLKTATQAKAELAKL